MLETEWNKEGALDYNSLLKLLKDSWLPKFKSVMSWSDADAVKATTQLWDKISGSSDKSGDITMDELYGFLETYTISNKGSAITFKNDDTGADEDGQGGDDDDGQSEEDKKAEEEAKKKAAEEAQKKFEDQKRKEAEEKKKAEEEAKKKEEEAKKKEEEEKKEDPLAKSKSTLIAILK